MNKKIIIALAVVVLLSFSSQIILAASSPYLFYVNITKNTRLQVRGYDKPHGIMTFGSYPGYVKFVHSNCYHVHGELKTLANGKEVGSIGVSVPLYCKGLTKMVGQAFDEAAATLGLSRVAFMKIGSGVFFSILLNIPSVGNPGDTLTACNQNVTTNSSACYWQVK